MPNLILRGLDDVLNNKLRIRAARNGRSVSAELREIVRDALGSRGPKHTAELKKLAAEIRALSAGRRQTPAEDLVREGRGDR